MPIPDPLTKFAVGKILGMVGKEMLSAIQGDTLGYETLKKRLDVILHMVEDLRMVPMKAAWDHIRLGEYEKARDDFLQASHQTCAAVASFFLAFAFWWEGKSEMAIEKFQEALAMNPYLLFLTYPEANRMNSPVQAILNEGTNLLQTCQWSVDLAPDLIRGELPSRDLWRWLRDGLEGAFSPGQREAVKAVRFSLGGEHPVFHCELGKDEAIFGALDYTAGDLLWVRRYFTGILSLGPTLYFATPRYVILREEENVGTVRFHFLDMETGEPVCEMSREYFATAFCPYNQELEKLEVFQRSHTGEQGGHILSPFGGFGGCCVKVDTRAEKTILHGPIYGEAWYYETSISRVR